MGSVYRRGSKLWLRVKRGDGSWASLPSGFEVGQERQARAALDAAENQVDAERRLGRPVGGQLTVRLFALRWLETRAKLVRTVDCDESHLRLYVFPKLGELKLDAVEPRHLAELFRELRERGEHAPRTLYNCYATLRALFRDACIEGLLATSPCVLTKHQLGKKRDRDPEWRAGAQFSRSELEALVTDSRVPADRRVLWALMGAAGLRAGEAFGLRWRHFDPEPLPLGRLLIATSGDSATTKTGDTRPVPVHPVLASLLAEWKLSGWCAAMGRQPAADDLVVPLPPTKKHPSIRMRRNSGNLRHLLNDLERLDLRPRRVHDLRRTFISLLRADGADKFIIRRFTHKVPEGDVMEGYTSFDFEILCREVLKLRLDLGPRGDVLKLPAASGESLSSRPLGNGLATVLATVARPTRRSPGNLSASGAPFQRGVGDLNA